MTHESGSEAFIELADEAIRWVSDRRTRGESVSLSELPDRFSPLLEEPKAVLRLVEADVRIRAEHSDPAAAEDYLRTFPNQQDEIQELLRQTDPAATTVASCADAQLQTDIVTGDVLAQHVAAVPQPGAGPPALPERIGRYRILEILGTGSFGTVFRARDEELDREVAIKIPRRVLAPGTPVEEFRSEAQKLAALTHPNLVPVYDFGVDEHGRPYFVTEFLAGPTLEQQLRDGEISQRAATHIVQQVAHTLHHAHRRGLVHRDVKPGNIISDEEGNPRLLDFGLALFEEDQVSRRNETAGTPAYMSPEQVAGKSHLLDGRTDIWALGVVLYEVWTGQRPFRGAAPAVLFEQIRERDPKPVRMVADVPEGIGRIVDRCLQKTVTDRYASAADLADDLERFLSADNSAATAETPPGPQARQRWLLVTVPSLIVVLGLLWYATRPTDGDSVAPDPAASEVALQDGDVVVSLWNNEDPNRRGLALEDALPLRTGDAIRVTATVNRPAYVYLVWLAGEGHIPLYPWRDGDWEDLPADQKKLKAISLPEQADEGWPMEVSRTMETIVMFASAEPLRDVDFQSLFDDYPVPETNAAYKLIRLDDKPRPAARLRSPQLKTVKLNAPLRRARQFLTSRLAEHAELVRATAFWNPTADVEQDAPEGGPSGGGK